VLVALSCASLALVSFLGVVIFSLEMEDHAQKLTEAAIIAEEMMKELQKGEFPPLGYEEGKIQGRPGFLFRRLVGETFIEGVREVRVEILWDDGKRGTSFLCYTRKK